jgi:hypothetical protein
MKTLLLQAVIMAFGLPQAYGKLAEFPYMINFATKRMPLLVMASMVATITGWQRILQGRNRWVLYLP